MSRRLFDGRCRCETRADHGCPSIPRRSAPPRRRDTSPRPQLLETYRYTDELGALLYEIVRYDPKDFRARRPDGSGGWIWGLSGVRRVLYQLPAVLKAKSDGHALVVFVEGEKDCHALAALGVVATTIAGGVQGTLPADFVTTLAGLQLTILPDNDDPGRAFATRSLRNLDPWSRRVL